MSKHDATGDANPRILVLAWHSPEGWITAGGFRRAVEVVGRMSASTRVIAVDSSPTMLRGGGATKLEIYQYSLPRLPLLAKFDSRPARLLQWIGATFHLWSIGARLARRRSFDVIYVPTSELLPCALAGVLLKFQSRRPLVMCNQNIEGVFLPRLVVALHNKADLVTTVSESLAASLRMSGVRRRIRVTYNGLPIGGSDAPPPETQKTWDGIFIGRHTKEKGLLDVLDIWEHVLIDSPNVRLALVGNCQPKEERGIIKRFARSPELGSHVVRLGILSDEEKVAVLQRSRVLLAPSRVEGWGFVPLEALICRVPVVCWDLPVYRESLPDVPAVNRIPVGHLELFADGVKSLLRLTDTERVRLLPRATSIPATSWDQVSSAELEAIRVAVNAPT